MRAVAVVVVEDKLSPELVSVPAVAVDPKYLWTGKSRPGFVKMEFAGAVLQLGRRLNSHL